MTCSSACTQPARRAVTSAAAAAALSSSRAASDDDDDDDDEDDDEDNEDDDDERCTCACRIEYSGAMHARRSASGSALPAVGSKTAAKKSNAATLTDDDDDDVSARLMAATTLSVALSKRCGARASHHVAVAVASEAAADSEPTATDASRSAAEDDACRVC